MEQCILHIYEKHNIELAMDKRSCTVLQYDFQSVLFERHVFVRQSSGTHSVLVLGRIQLLWQHHSIGF